jgi:hypothetical protein
MSGPVRRACDQCLGTDTQYECERGQCYAEQYQQEQENRRAEEEWEREQHDWQRRCEEERRP